jgi:hypothetical protein
MIEAPDFGIPGLGDMVPGDHVCALYAGASERDAMLYPFVQAGLRSGDKCLCLIDEEDTASVRMRICTGAGVDAASGQLQVHRSPTTATGRAPGHFVTEDMIGFLEDWVRREVSGRVPFARVVGEMSWALRELPSLDELVRFESEFNRYVVQYPQWGLCLYDLGRFGGGILVDVLKTHPKILLGGMVLDNPHYLTPDEFLAQRN